MGAQADQVRNDILRRVLERALMPGDRIDEAELRTRLGLSGTPIREALIMLEAVGVIERRPRGGAWITMLSLEQMMKLVEVLAEAEGSVAFLAARRINAEQAHLLRQAARACTEFAAGRSEHSPTYYDCNLGFHHALITAAGNEYMERAVFQVGNRLVAYLNARHELPGEAERSAGEHQAICDAVLQADGARARDLMIRHVTFGDRMALDVMNALRRQG